MSGGALNGEEERPGSLRHRMGPTCRRLGYPISRQCPLFPSPSPVPRQGQGSSLVLDDLHWGGLAGAQHTQTALLTHLANNCPKPTSFLRASPSPILHPHVHSHQEARMCGKKEVHVKARGGALRGCGCHQTPANATRMGCKCTSVPPVAWPAALALVLIRVLARIWKQTCPSQGSTLGSGKPHWPNQFPGTDFWTVILNLQQAHDPSTPLEEGPPPPLSGDWAGQCPPPEFRPVQLRAVSLSPGLSYTSVHLFTQQHISVSLFQAAEGGLLPESLLFEEARLSSGMVLSCIPTPIPDPEILTVQGFAGNKGCGPGSSS